MTWVMLALRTAEFCGLFAYSCNLRKSQNNMYNGFKTTLVSVLISFMWDGHSLKSCIHTELVITTIQSGLQPSFSYHLFVCFNLTHEQRDLQLKLKSKRETVLRHISRPLYLLTEFSPEICRASRRTNVVSYFVLLEMSEPGGGQQPRFL